GHPPDDLAGGLASRSRSALTRRGDGGEVLGGGRGSSHRVRRPASPRRHRRGRRLPDSPLLPVVEGARADPRLRRTAARPARRVARGGALVPSHLGAAFAAGPLLRGAPPATTPRLAPPDRKAGAARADLP